jgi:hypothetical protein
MDALDDLIENLPPEDVKPSAKEEEAPEKVESVEKESEPEEEEEPVVGKKSPQFRLRPGNEIDTLTLQIQSRNPDLTLSECMERAKAKLAPAEEASAKESGEKPASAESSLPKTVAEFEAREDELTRLKLEARRDFDNDKEEKYELELIALRRNASKIQANERAALQSAEAEFDAAFEASTAEAVELYKDAGVPNSAFANRMREIDQELKATGNDLYYDPAKTLKIAQMVGNEMAIAPRRKAPASTSPSPTAKASPPPPMAPGSARTSTQPAESQRKAEIERMVNAIQTPEDIEDLIATM